MVRLTAEEAAHYEENGFVVIAAPWEPRLTEECLAATHLLQSGSTPDAVAVTDTVGNHWRLKPVSNAQQAPADLISRDSL